MGLSSIADLPKRANSVLHHLVWPNKACVTLTQDGSDPYRGGSTNCHTLQMVKPTCTLQLHGAQSISNLPSGERRVSRLTFWKLTASSLARLKAVANWSVLLLLSCFVQCFLHAPDLRDSAVHGSEPSPLLSLKVTWIWRGSSAFRTKAWAPAAPFARDEWHHYLNSALDLLSTAYCGLFLEKRPRRQ